MGQRLGIKAAAAATGLTEYTLRNGIRQGRFPYIRTGLGNGRILIDVDLLEKYLKQEAEDNIVIHQKSEVVNYGRLRMVKA